MAMPKLILSHYVRFIYTLEDRRSLNNAEFVDVGCSAIVHPDWAVRQSETGA